VQEENYEDMEKIRESIREIRENIVEERRV
jgi:hypothetical protein